MKMKTPVFRGSYVNVLTPSAVNPGDAPKFGIQVVLPKADPFWAELKKNATAVAEAKWGKPLPKTLRWGVNDGDQTERDEVQGCYYINLSSKADRAPGVVDAQLQPILSTEEVYSGAHYRATFTIYAWDNTFGKGVSYGLANVMKIRDDETFGTPKARPEDDFAEEATGTDGVPW